MPDWYYRWAPHAILTAFILYWQVGGECIDSIPVTLLLLLLLTNAGAELNRRINRRGHLHAPISSEKGGDPM